MGACGSLGCRAHGRLGRSVPGRPIKARQVAAAVMWDTALSEALLGRNAFVAKEFKRGMPKSPLSPRKTLQSDLQALRALLFAARLSERCD